MELRELIKQMHQLQVQLNDVDIEDKDLNKQIDSLKSEIKTRLDSNDKEFSSLSEQEFQSLMADLGDPTKIIVEVVYATASNQVIEEVQLERGASIEDGIIMSGILDKCPDIDLSVNKVGIHGAIKQLNTALSDKDRIEIYRPVVSSKN